MSFVELHLYDTSEPISINVSRILSFERKPFHEGAMVWIALVGGKEFAVSDSYADVRDAIHRVLATGESASIEPYIERPARLETGPFAPIPPLDDVSDRGAEDGAPGHGGRPL